MSRSIAYLTSRVNFVQVSDEIPITKQRNPEKVDPPDVFEGSDNFHAFLTLFSLSLTHGLTTNRTANKKELVDDLMMKAQQIEYLIQSLPIPEPEEVQVRSGSPTWLGRVSEDVDAFPSSKGCAPSDPRGRDARSESRLCSCSRPSQYVSHHTHTTSRAF